MPTDTRARAHALSDNVKTQYLSPTLIIHGHENASRARERTRTRAQLWMGAPERDTSEHGKSVLLILSRGLSKGSERRKRMFIYILMESKNARCSRKRTFLDLPSRETMRPNRENIRVKPNSEKRPINTFIQM